MRELDVRIASAAAGYQGLAVRVAVPDHGRWGDEAPVAVHVPGGWDGGDLARISAPLATLGFVEVRFVFPGGGRGAGTSGGAADLRGRDAVQALADIMKFASGRSAARDGRSLQSLCGAVRPRVDQVGLVGWSNGGNTATVALAQHQDASRSVAWLAMWETPWGEGAAVALAGSRRDGANPAWDAAAHRMDWRSLRYHPLLPVTPFTPVEPSSVAPVGAFFFDLNSNGEVDLGEPVPRPLPVPGRQSLMAYPVSLLTAAKDLGATGRTWPPHLLPPRESEAFWAQRDGARNALQAVVNLPKLLVGAVGSREDHLQAAPDHPHVAAAYTGWLTAGAWTRLGPDAAYVGAVLGDGGNYPETPAGRTLSAAELVERLAPEGIPDAVLVAAMAAELADRARAADRTPDLDVLLSPTVALRPAP